MKQELIERFKPHAATRSKGFWEANQDTKIEAATECAKIAEQHRLEGIIEALKDLEEPQSCDCQTRIGEEIQSYQSQLKELTGEAENLSKE